MKVRRARASCSGELRNGDLCSNRSAALAARWRCPRLALVLRLIAVGTIIERGVPALSCRRAFSSSPSDSGGRPALHLLRHIRTFVRANVFVRSSDFDFKTKLIIFRMLSSYMYNFKNKNKPFLERPKTKSVVRSPRVIFAFNNKSYDFLTIASQQV